MAETFRYWYSAEHDKANHTRWRGGRAELTNVYRDSVRTQSEGEDGWKWAPFTLCFVVPPVDILRNLEAKNQPTAEDKYRLRWLDAVLVHTSQGQAVTSVEREPSLWRPWTPPSAVVERAEAMAEAQPAEPGKARRFRLDVVED
jgi:hypothetical protein